MHAALIAALLFAASGAAPFRVVVDERVDTIAICHSANADVCYFFGFVQNEWATIDHRWISNDFQAGRDGPDWILTFEDWGDECQRVVRTTNWIETWQEVSPREEEKQRPWFRQQTEPGLKQPPKLAANEN